MDEKLYDTFDVKEIIRDGDAVRMVNREKKAIGELSLRIYINGREYASLLCLNQFTEELALGFIYSEGVIDSLDDVASLSRGEEPFSLMVELTPGRSPKRCESLRSVASGGGRSFTAINPPEHVTLQPLEDRKEHYSIGDILTTMKDFEGRSRIYREIGGVHSVLFQRGDVSLFNEDIGRHNCFDKIAGMLLREGRMDLLASGSLFVSGRVSSEIITKVIRLGVPLLVSRATPTAAAVRLAREYNVTLLGYLRGEGGFVYAGESRLA